MITYKQLKEELCIDCPDKPMDECPCGCMRKAILNNFVEKDRQLIKLNKELAYYKRLNNKTKK